MALRSTYEERGERSVNVGVMNQCDAEQDAEAVEKELEFVFDACPPPRPVPVVACVRAEAISLVSSRSFSRSFAS